ncbi:30S ribosomal protein S8 [bacterium (Candidatus Gribaldobacteria) CG08_land_8_20_14_0_20_39_15]|uniref:Small ribosomal subunit protein uS8 n=1 Tax=bacterium (Candidatus Gribaldobacteria) CG08_land_8_20_14_0_20_39_15 TaxID=2014273 RepID=A0A2M6XUW8_9BACT|nr:MAG: 30S ribosomal protein S8 [bacterium (Candidatus Gribaldobacteria) CG08_land_8_20_14_0_20_39_15]
MTDPIADLLNRIKNAQAVLHPVVNVPCSNLKARLVEILKSEGFISDFKKRGKKDMKILRIGLKYNKDKTPAISGFKRVSKPGQRIYKKSKEIRRVKNGYGLAIISTNQGLLTDKEARKKELGGEVMLEVW